MKYLPYAVPLAAGFIATLIDPMPEKVGVMLLGASVGMWLESRFAPKPAPLPELQRVALTPAGEAFLLRNVNSLLEDRRLLWGQLRILEHQIHKLRRRMPTQPDEWPASAQFESAEAAQ